MSGAATLDIGPSDLEIVRGILRRHVPGRQVCAFGSRVTGTARKYSDLDLVVMGDAPVALSAMAALAEAFSESDLPFKVDLVDWVTATPSFRDIIRINRIVVQPADNRRCRGSPS